MGLKSLRDFATENGVTLRAVQKHIQKYAQDLGDHVVRYGPPRGTFIDETAQEILQKHLVGDPIAVMDHALSDEVEKLRAELDNAQKRIMTLLEEKNALLAERTTLTERALQAETRMALAEASQEDQEQKVRDLEAKLAESEETTRRLKGRTLWQRIRRWGE